MTNLFKKTIDPFLITCPICGKKTFVRIQIGNFLNEYPVRFNCMNCKTLIKGKYIMHANPDTNELIMNNSKIEVPCPEEGFGTYNVNGADYYFEVSGELPTKNIEEYKGGIPETPFLRSVSQISHIENHIERLSYFQNSINDWEKKKSIAFQLLDDGSIDFIAKALDNKLGNYKYECNHYLRSLHCLQIIIEENLKNLFVVNSEDFYIFELLDFLRNTDKTMIKELVNATGGVNELVNSYRKTVEVFSNFMKIYTHVLPAETYLHYQDRFDDTIGISTCSFNDIKNYYQDSYESLLSLMTIPVCLDNILLRKNYDSFDNKYEDTIKNKDKNDTFDLNRYIKLDNGTKANKISVEEPYQRMVSLPANRPLRNAIGHNNFIYDGITQTITYYDKNKTKQIKLITVATNCIEMAKSSLIVSEILLYLLREKFRDEGITTLIHPRYYKHIEVNDLCPCGSGLKFKKCCMREYKKIIDLNNNPS